MFDYDESKDDVLTVCEGQIKTILTDAYDKGLKDGYRFARERKWIPCSERLPDKEFGTYLICTETGYMCSCRWTNDMYGLGATEWSKWGWHIMDKPQYSVVTAWMPLQPWKGADNELVQ